MAVPRADTEAGSAAAGLVVLFPVLVVMFMALVQWGLWFHAQCLVDAAAQDAGRAARAADGTAEDGRAVAAGLLAEATASGLLGDLAVDVAEEAGAVRAEVRARVPALVPLAASDLTVVGVAEGPKEAFLAGGAP